VCDAYSEMARKQIDDADLPSTVYRTARRLLDRAEKAAGIVVLQEDEFMTICQSDAEGTLRSHLVQLQSAGILHYSRRGKIRITFTAWGNPELPLVAGAEEKVIARRSTRALGDQLEPEDSEEVIARRSSRALGDHFAAAESEKVIAERSTRALSDQNHPKRLTRARTRALVGGLVDLPDPPTRARNQPTNQPPADSPPESELVPEEAYTQLAFDLLVDREVGITYEVAKLLARTLPCLDIYRVVDDWLPERREGKVKTGALVSRLRRIKPSEAPTIALSTAFLVSDLFQRHKLPDELITDPEAEKRRKYRPDKYSDIILG
jgi:hypothetical protein